MRALPSPSQTVGPFPHEAWRWAFVDAAGANAAPGEVVIAGHVFDGEANPVSDAILEAAVPGAPVRIGDASAWQRVASDESGAFRFWLPSRPAAAVIAPALFVIVFARGLLVHQFTALWLADDPQLADSPVLRQIPEARRTTLLAVPMTGAAPASARYAWDLHLQGPRETVFFDLH